MTGIPHEVIVSNFAEDLDKAQFPDPGAYVVENARQKASTVACRLRGGTEEPDLVIGADTVVVLDGEILEKPTLEADAYRMLHSMSGRRHTVLSGVAKFVKGNDTCAASFYEATRYIKTREPMDKAGAYGIQGVGGSLVTGISGCYFNVMGLPMHHFTVKLSSMIEQGLI